MRRSARVIPAVVLAFAAFAGVQPAAEAAIETLYFTLTIANTIDGVNYDENDILKHDFVSGTTSLFFDGDTLFKDSDERIDALYIFPNGDLLVSTTTGADIGALNFERLDLVRVDPVTKNASVFLDGNAVFKQVQDLDAVDVLEDGKLLLAAGQGKIGAAELEFKSRDIVLYDPLTGDASIFFKGSDHFEGQKGTIKGVDLLPDGKLVLIIGDETDAVLGGVNVNRKDIVLYDPTSKTTQILLSGDGGYFEREGHEHDQGFASVFVPPSPPVIPEPFTASLFGVGLLGAGVFRRRFKA